MNHAVYEYIRCLQMVWSVILQKSPFPSPQAIRLLDMKNDTVVSMACFAFAQ